MNDNAGGRFDAMLDTLDRVVWAIEVRDPHQLTADGICDRTRAAMSELAAGHGGWGIGTPLAQLGPIGVQPKSLQRTGEH